MNGFKKVSVKRCLAEKFHRQRRRTYERPQNPRELAAEEKIARQPHHEHAKRDGSATAKPRERLEQAHIARHTRKRDHRDMRQQNGIVS